MCTQRVANTEGRTQYLLNRKGTRQIDQRFHGVVLWEHDIMERSTDRYWAGLSSDLVIEQVLMRSMKSTGRLTRGRWMCESERTQ